MTEPVTLPTTRSNVFDPPPALGELRTKRPIAPLNYPDGHLGWLVTEHATARAMLADPRFSARQELRHMPIDSGIGEMFAGKPADPGMFIRMDPPDHTRYRRLLTGQFTVRRMNQLAPRIEQIVNDHLDAMEAAGPPVDLVQAYALPIPSLVICELLGVPYEDRDRFQRNSKVILGLDTRKEQRTEALADLTGYLRELVVQKQTEPTDDILGGLAEGGELNDEELTNIAFLLLVAGHETTANMLGLGTYALLRNPDQLAAFTAADEAGVNDAVEELLRYLTIIQFGTIRAATEDVELDGVQIKAGDCITISLPAGNRDPERFSEPEKLDVTRSASGHLTFGHGIHQCLGQQLARIEMRLGYALLFRRFPGLRLAVPPDQVPVRDDMAIYGVHELPVTW